MRIIIVTLLITVFSSVTAIAASNPKGTDAQTSSYKIAPPAKDEKNASDSAAAKKKVEKPVKETLLTLLLRFEKK